MRFHVRVEISIEVPDLAHAQGALGRIEQATHEAAGEAAVRGETNALWQAEMTPQDAAARKALADDDLGPGISSAGSSA